MAIAPKTKEQTKISLYARHRPFLIAAVLWGAVLAAMLMLIPKLAIESAAVAFFLT